MNTKFDSGHNNVSLATFVETNIGNDIQFNNGCWISLTSDNGFFWGNSPYGVEWGVDSDKNYIQAVVNWVEYWDESRTETGEIITL